MKNLFSLNEIESSPFFTASWEPRFLKKLLVIFGSSTFVYIVFACFFVETYCSIPMFFDGTSHKVVLANKSKFSLPLLVVVTPATKKKLFVTNFEDNKTYKLTGVKYGDANSRVAYTVWDKRDPIKFEIFKNSSKIECEIRVPNPKVEVAEYIIQVVCFIICLSTVILCYKTPSLQQFIILYLLICLYSFLNLSFFGFSNSTKTFFSMLFFFGFISISFLQVRILSSNIPTLFSAVFGVCGLCSIMTFLAITNSMFFIPSFGCLLLLVGVSIYLYCIGTTILSPFLLTVHFGWMWGIGLSVYITTILKIFTIEFQQNFLVDILCDVLVSVFVVFQSIYLIGEPAKAKIPEAPLDQVSRLNRIDHLIESLSEREDVGIKHTAGFQ